MRRRTILILERRIRRISSDEIDGTLCELFRITERFKTSKWNNLVFGRKHTTKIC